MLPPKPTIYLRTPNGLVPTSSDEAMATRSAMFERMYVGARDVPPPIPFLKSLSGPQRPPLATPIYPQYYYVRPEHTPTGYIEGRYGRIDNFTPGEHSSTGYTPGHYRADGNYTRPEHTSTGYIPGHYRAEPQPNPATSPPPAFRPYGR